MNDRVYVWAGPRDLDAAAAEALIAGWEADGGDPGASPFHPSTDIGWFHRELVRDEPDLIVVSDAIPNPSTRPVWLSGTDEPPAKVVNIEIGPETSVEAVDDVASLAAKYDLVVFDRARGRLHHPLQELADDASATFWPGGAIEAAVAGGIGLVIAIVAWIIAIPIVSGVAIVIGGFMAVMAVVTFVHEGRTMARGRRTGDDPPPSD
ncbi:MAG TPA: hypothetical protein VF119_10825 [Candidatus Limnocylindrales bacterium]